jgi:hypothetical protein
MRSKSGSISVEYIAVFTIVIVVVLTTAFSSDYSPFQYKLKRVYYRQADQINLATQYLTRSCGQVQPGGGFTPCQSKLRINGDPFPEGVGSVSAGPSVIVDYTLPR